MIPTTLYIPASVGGSLFIHDGLYQQFHDYHSSGWVSETHFFFSFFFLEKEKRPRSIETHLSTVCYPILIFVCVWLPSRIVLIGQLKTVCGKHARQCLVVRHNPSADVFKTFVQQDQHARGTHCTTTRSSPFSRPLKNIQVQHFIGDDKWWQSTSEGEKANVDKDYM